MGKTKTKSRRRSAAARPVQGPERRERPRRLPAWAYALGGTLLVALFAGGALLLAREQAESGREGPAAAAGGLPNTSDYHSLLAARSDPRHLMLETHAGLYESLDGGRSWKQVALAGQDAMNLARSEGGTAWAAGHNVLARSNDGGKSWSDVRPDGLPSLDVHGFAVTRVTRRSGQPLQARASTARPTTAPASCSSRRRSAATSWRSQSLQKGACSRVTCSKGCS